jgi:hypothetical protein
MKEQKSLIYILKNTLHLCNLGDLLAAPFFLFLVIYFYNIEQRTFFEDILLLFSLLGFIVDAISSICFLLIYTKKPLFVNNLF